MGLLLAGVVFGMPVRATATQVLHGTVPVAVASLPPTGTVPNTTVMSFAIGLPLRNTNVLSAWLKQVYDPTSPNYRVYLKPAQFAAQFGPTASDYQAVINYAKAQGFTITGTHSNRLVVDVSGSVAQIDKAFHVTMNVYQHPTEARTFYAPNANPSLNLTVPVLSIAGLDNYAPPRSNRKIRQRDPIGVTNPKTGSGPSGTYAGNDFRAAYVPGTPLTGAGQSVALVQFDGYNPSDIAAYLAAAGISTSATLINVPVNGGVSTPGPNNGEVCLDIEMAIAMAPGLSTIFVYEAPNSTPWVSMFSRIANDNQARQISCSWGGGGPDPASEQVFLQMAAQGQSLFNASGDNDAFTGQVMFPSDSPNVIQVGGTTLSTTGPAGSFISETVWNWGGGIGSSGGISTTYSIPRWQQGLSMGVNQGSTTMRNTPDVAMVADNIIIVADNGQVEPVGGTSCAAPLWAGFTALVNQQAAASGQAPVGMFNPAIYAIGKGVNYSTDFHDVTTGNNECPTSPTKFTAVAGYDLCTGWGSPTVNLISDLISISSSGGGVTPSDMPTTQPAQHPFDITRSTSYWFTHVYTNDPICASATLEQAIAANGGTLNLGFLTLPTANYTSGNVPAINALMEALGFYYKGSGVTGDGQTASALCQARKKLAPELIAAIANNVLLGTGPENATYDNGGVATPFPPDLIDQAGVAAAGADVTAIQVLTALLHKFNASGITNDFDAALAQVECAPNTSAFLGQISRDPTTFLNCPGINNNCATPQVITFPSSTNPFALARFTQSVDTRKYSLNQGQVFWEIPPVIGLAGRRFTVNTTKSNYPVNLTVASGQCSVVTTNGITWIDSSGLSFVAGFNGGSIFGTSTNGTSSSSTNSVVSNIVQSVTFTTDGVSPFLIIATPSSIPTGKLVLTLTSP